MYVDDLLPLARMRCPNVDDLMLGEIIIDSILKYREQGTVIINLKCKLEEFKNANQNS